jgi:hypothetical protein
MLGTVTGNGKATMEKDKVEAIRNWETPTTIKDVERFLGFANFYRQFIKNFSMITATSGSHSCPLIRRLSNCYGGL